MRFVVYISGRLKFDFATRYGGRYQTSTIHHRRGRVAWFAKRPDVLPAPPVALSMTGLPPE